MFKRISLFFAGMVSAQQVDLQNPYGLRTLVNLNNMIDPHALQPTILNLRLMENNLNGAKLELQNMVDPMTVIAGVKAGTEAAG